MFLHQWGFFHPVRWLDGQSNRAAMVLEEGYDSF
jgi:hypothetical protein